LRKLVSGSAAAEGIRWSIAPGPDFFAALRAEAEGWTVALAEDADGRVLGFVSVAVRTVSLLGRPHRTCYVTNLMVRPEHRGRGIGDALCWRATELCRRAGGDAVPVLMAIRTRNRHMRRRVLGARGLPGLARFARVGIHSLPVHRAAAVARDEGLDVRSATAADLEDMAAIWDDVTARRQFAPGFDAARLARWIEGAPGLALTDHLIARSSGRIMGWMGLWDEAAVREVRVAGYSRTAALRRCVQDVRARVVGAPRPPRVGERVGSARAVHTCVPAGRPDVLRALLAEGARRRAPDCRWLKIALDVRDPLARALDGLGTRVAAFDAHVTTPMGGYHGLPLDDRPLHFEAALA
jgi:ribosomal protein S18 acetylase RimI-like enzyme